MTSHEKDEVPTRDTSCPKLSEIEPCKSTNYNFPTMTLLPLFLDLTLDYRDLQVMPSVYMRQMYYSTEERYKELCSAVRQVYSLPGFTAPTNFKVVPRIIIFQNCLNPSCLVLSITNISKTIRHLKMSCDYQPNVTVKYRESSERKLAAGMTVRFTVEYTPSLTSDHFHKIVFSTDTKETFTVPIIGMCCRQMLDLPDSIQMPITPVKVESKKTLIVRNISSCAAVANFISERPFQVEPDKIYLGPEEITTLTLSFFTPYLGSWKKKLTVQYETGEKVVISLEGSSELGKVYLSDSKVVISDTFMGMKRQSKVCIHNETDSIIQFEWQLFSSIEEDQKVLSKFRAIYESYHETEKKGVAKLKYFDLLDEDTHEIICSRISRDNIQFATSQHLHFKHKRFEIFPLQGEIWPGGECQCTVVFSSEAMGDTSAEAYLEVGGLESRLPLRLCGTALGPNLRLNIDSLDVGEIHLMQVFSAQIIVENVGDIAGRVCYVKREPAFDSTISCTPLYYQLEPGQTKPFLVSISRPKVGKFLEDVHFEIFESGANLTCVIKGSVEWPPLTFSESIIDFEEVVLGFEIVKTIKMLNPSDMLFAFTLETTGYWEQEAVRAWDQQPISAFPRQFSIFPSDGLIKPHQQLEIKIVALLNCEDNGTHSIRMSVWDINMEHLTLPIKYSVSQLSVRSLTPEIFINFAFLNCEYKQQISIVNDSDSTAFISIYQESPCYSVECCIQETEGVMRPFDHITINVSFKVLQVGSQCTRIMLKPFCSSNNVLICTVTLIGIQPVLNLEPMELDWGSVVLLAPATRTFSILNVSPVPARYMIQLDKVQDMWKLDEANGIILPESSKQVDVTLLLTNIGPIEATLVINSDGGDLKLKMKATGVGSAIAIMPRLCPSFRMGHLLCSVLHEIDVKIMNRSSLVHELLWSTCDNLNNWTKADTSDNQGVFFKIVPYRMQLKPGQEEILKLSAYCEEEKEVEEVYYCLGVIGQKSRRSEGRKTLGECILSASFHQPKLKLSKNEVKFCIKVAPDDPFPLSPSQTVTVTPDFTQEVTLKIEVKSPFKLVADDDLLLDCMTIQLKDAQPLEITVMFDTSFRTDGYSWSADASLLFSYKNHPCKAILPLHGEVQYPNVVLNCHLVDFGGIHRHSQSYKEIIMKNLSPYDVHFSWEWCSITLEPLPKPPTQPQESKPLVESMNDLVEWTEESGRKLGCTLADLNQVQEDKLSVLNFGQSANDAEELDAKSITAQESIRQIDDDSEFIPLMIRESLDILIGDSPTPLVPSDLDIVEEDRLVYREIALIIRHGPLFEKFSSIVMSNVQNLGPSAMSLNDIFHQVEGTLKELQECIVREEINEDFQDTVVPFISQYIDKHMLESVHAILPTVKHNTQPSVSELIDLSPKWGVLLSGQEQVVGAVLKPHEDVTIQALAVCKIRGGPTEKISFKGTCCTAKYSLDRLIDLGFILFCEVTTVNWIVKNDCAINIMFRIINNSQIVNVEPGEGCLTAFSDVTFQIMCLPVFLGPVSSHFYIELATLEVVKVSVEGMSVMPQVLLDLPEQPTGLPLETCYRAIASLTHPAFSSVLGTTRGMSIMSKSPSRDRASVSSCLTHKPRSSINDWHYDYNESETPCLTDIKMAYERCMMTACVAGDTNKVKIHSTLKDFKNKYFNDCLLPGYTIDFESVMLDSTVEKTIHIFNLGYVVARLTLSLGGDEENLKNHGISVTWTGPCVIPPGSLGEFCITLSPKSSFYLDSFYKMKLNFVLRVCCGPTIPIKMLAFIVQPELTVKGLLEFGELKCSQAKTLPLVLTNIGPVIAEWTVVERVLRRKEAECSVAASTDKLESPFFLDRTTGIVLPGNTAIVMVTFIPHKQGVYERVMEVRIADSRSCPKCKIRGSALEPHIIATQMQLDFGNVAPFISVYEQDFSIFNPCPFPVEISLIDYDNDEEKQNKVLRAMCEYYRTDRMHLPLKFFDTAVSSEVKGMYQSMARLGAMLKLAKLQQIQESQLQSDEDGKPSFAKQQSMSEKSRVQKGVLISAKSKLTSTKNLKKSRISLRKRSVGQDSNSNVALDRAQEVENYMANLSLEQIDQLVLDYVSWLHNIPENDLNDIELMERMKMKFDVLETLDKYEDTRRRITGHSEPSFFSSLNTLKESVSHLRASFEERLIKGTLVIFHGAPFTDYAYLANKAAREMALKAVTLDSIIAEEAAYSHGPSAIFIRDTINTAYAAIMAHKVDKEEQEEVGGGSHVPIEQEIKSGEMERTESITMDQQSGSEGKAVIVEEEEDEGEEWVVDPLNDLLMKIEAINSYAIEEAKRRAEEAAAQARVPTAVKGSKSAKSSGTKSTKESAKLSRKEMPVDVDTKSDTLLDIGMDVFYDLISFRLKLDILDSGALVDNLSGGFIRNPVKCLEMLANIAGPIKNIYVVHVFTSFETLTAVNQKKKQHQDMVNMMEAQEVCKRLRSGVVDLDVIDRKKYLESLDLYHTLTLQMRNDMLAQLEVDSAKEVVLHGLEDEMSTAMVPKKEENGKGKKKKSIGTPIRKSKSLTDKAKLEVSKASSSSKNRGSKSKQLEVEPTEVPEVSPEELALKAYHEDLGKMLSFLEKFDRIKNRTDGQSDAGKDRFGKGKRAMSISRGHSVSTLKIATPPKEPSEKERLHDNHDQLIVSRATDIKNPSLGIPLIIISSTKISLHMDFMAQILNLKHILKVKDDPIRAENADQERTDSRLIEPEMEKYFWYDKPPLFVKEKLCPFFCLMDKNPPQELRKDTGLLLKEPIIRRLTPEANYSLLPGKKLSSHMLRREGSSKSTGIAAGKLLTRSILSTGAQLSWIVTFYPERVGQFRQELRIRVSGWPRSLCSIAILANVELPDVNRDPHSIFYKVIDDQPMEGGVSKPSYIISTSTFDFGFTFIQESSEQSAHSICAKLKLINSCKLLVRAFLSFNSGTHFKLETNVLNVKVGEMKSLVVWASPHVEGVVQDLLIVSILNNPNPLIIQLCCTGVKGQVCVMPKELQFNKVLLRHSTTKTIVITNLCGLPLYWKFKPLEDLGAWLSVTPISGSIQGLSQQLVHFMFRAADPGVINKPVTLQVFDKSLEIKGELVQSLVIPVKVEAYDVIVDICFPDGDLKELHYGDIKVETEHSRLLVLENKGNYDIEFRINLDNFPFSVPYAPSDIFSLSLTEGLLPAKAKLPLRIQVTVRCVDELKLDHTPMFSITLFSILDGSSHVANVPVPVSLSSHYTKLKLIPKDEVGFGSVLVGETKVLYLTVENTGYFEFTYKIMNKAELDEILNANDWGESGGGGPTVRDSHNKSFAGGRASIVDRSPETTRRKFGNADRKQIGPFTIYSLTGLVRPESSVKIKITCSPSEEANFREVMLFQASELPEPIRYGLPVNLIASGCLPSVNFSDSNFMFREAVVISDPSTQSFQDTSGLPVVVYSETTGLGFENIVVSTRKEMKIYLRNIGMVSSSIRGSILESGEKSKNCFTVSPPILHISAYATDSFYLSFTPNSIQRVEAELCMELEVPHSKPVVVKVPLSGCGCLPVVELISPIQMRSCSKSDKAAIDFGTCLLEFHISNILTFRNTGICHCKFLVEMSSDMEKCFSLAALPHCEHSVKPLHDTKGWSLACEAGPGRDVQLSCVFAPLAAVIYTCWLDIIIFDNPYERYKVHLSGRGFIDHVTVEGLPFIVDQQRTSNTSMKASKGATRSGGGTAGGGGSSSCSYSLDFGQVYVGRPIKQELKLRNHDDCWICYTWESTNPIGVTFYPRTGHLRPMGTTSIYAVLVPSKPLNLTKLIIRCNLDKVVHAERCSVEWNSHPKTVAWLKHEDRILRRYNTYSNVIESTEEPEVADIVRLGELRVQVQLEVDRPCLTCSHPTVVFPQTLICQGSWSEVKVKNTSRVEAVVRCTVVVTRAMPADSDACRPVFSSGMLPATSLYPNTGEIDSSSVISANLYPLSPLPTPVSSYDKSSLLLAAGESEVSAAKAVVRAREQYRSCPFVVEPESCTVKPGKTHILRLGFIPMQMFFYNARLVCLLDEVDENETCLNVELEGAALSSYCHLEIEEDTQYTPAHQECPDTVKILLVHCIGVPASYTRRFNVINPTDKDYHFEWIKCSWDEEQSELTEHVCSTPSGLIKAHKSCEMEFSFFGMEEGKHERLWLLRIPEMRMEQHLLFVSEVREPQVCFVSPTLTIKPTIASVTVTGQVCLLNQEDTEEVKFKVDKCSLFSEGRFEKVDIEPMCGSIPPLSSETFKVYYTPRHAGEVDFTVKVEVSKKREPVLLRVVTCCYSVDAVVTCCLEGTSQHLLLATDKKNNLSLGHIELRVPKRVEVSVKNTGRAGFYIEILKRDEQLWKKSHLEVEYETKSTFLAPDSSISLDLTFLATCKASFSSLPLIIKIMKGPVYELELCGDASGPEFIFSLSKYDFGYRFIQTSNNFYNTVELIFRNEDEVSLELEKLYKDKDHLKVELEYCVVPARSALTIVVHFFPRHCMQYSEEVEFLVNGIYSTIVLFTGIGVPLMVELVKNKDKLIELGTVLVGQTVSRSFDLVNRSERTAYIQLSTTSPGQNPHDETGHSLCFKPKHFNLHPGRPVRATISYTPLKRATHLTQKLWYSCEDTRDVLLVVEGRGVGAEMRLDRDMIPFGLTVTGATNTIKVALINSGDLGARFQWDMSKASECFKIVPKDGYSTPGSVLTFDFTFSPKCNTSKFVRSMVFCVVENYKSPLSLVVTGSCVDAPPPKEYVKFTTPVRQSVDKNITITNQTLEKWLLHPIISGNFFSGEEVLTVLPRSSVSYQLTYFPMIMTDKKDFHEGSAFFSYPDGESMLYGLRGVSGPPDAEPSVTWTTPAKKQFVGQIPIKNWLTQQSQRFSVEIKPTAESTKAINRNLFKIFGNAQIELGPNSTRMYDIHFFCYLPINLSFIVTYRSEAEGGEYSWLELGVTVTEPEILETLSLTTQVRKPVLLEIPFNNPLDIKQSLTCDSSDFQLTVTSPLLLAPKQTTVLKVTYLPVAIETRRNMELVVRSGGLGDFAYMLELTATPPPLPAVISVKATLGRSASISLPITNHTPVDAIYTIRIESKSLSGPKEVPVKALSNETINLTYEPYAEGKETVTISAESSKAGSFKFPVSMMGCPPEPQGPFELLPGKSLSINFKNVYLESKEFIMICESEFFSVKNPKRSLKSKQGTDFVVQMCKKEDLAKKDAKWSDTAITGKLVVSTTDNSPQQPCWLYYIKSNKTT